MCHRYYRSHGLGPPVRGLIPNGSKQLVADGGQPEREDSDDDMESDPQDGNGSGNADNPANTDESDTDDPSDTDSGHPERERTNESDSPDTGTGGSNVEITEDTEPADPKWEEPDLDDLPDFELGAEGPLTNPPETRAGHTDSPDNGESVDPGAGMPNTARSPEATRISSEGTDAYIVAIELCARLPDDVRLPEEAASLVPAAVEAELEQDIRGFAAAEFGTEMPHVDTLSFEDIDGEIWLRLRIGLPTEGFDDVDPEEIRSYALERLEGVL